MIVANISMGKDRTTQVTGKTIEEVVKKIHEYHSITEFEKSHFSKQGTLAKELKSGWYFKEA
jgi:hypothetical protein